MEWATSGNLRQHLLKNRILKSSSPSSSSSDGSTVSDVVYAEILHHARSIALAMAWLHSYKPPFLHGDLRLVNVLVRKGNNHRKGMPLTLFFFFFLGLVI